jgi:glycosyltransferase involved in cell wall biosynthesis
MDIIHFANTYVAKPGNIGVRTDRIIQLLATRPWFTTCMCRGATRKVQGIRYIEMGPLGQLPRILNAVRIYIHSGFNHRLMDLKLFELFAWCLAPRPRVQPRIAHVWDCCPKLISRLKKQGYRVILDVPIAPMAFVQGLQTNGLGSSLLYSPALAQLEVQAANLADVVLTPSEFVAHEMEKIGIPRTKIVVIEFGADRPSSRPELHAPTHAHDQTTFCLVGALNVRKGIPQLMQAWQAPEFATDQLLLCGRMFPDTRQWIADAHPGTVQAPGFVDVGPYLDQSDVFVLPTLLEGSSKAVYEAMSHGLPCIVSSSAGSVVRDGIDGFVIEPGDVSALRDRMLTLRRDPTLRLRMGGSARERAAQFTWDHYAQRVVDLYEEVASTC